jgi:hypothetical protein
LASAAKVYQDVTIDTARLSNRFTIWSEETGSIRIEFARAVLGEFQMEALLESRGTAEARRGREIGGLLYGTRLGSLVRVLAWKRVECEHAFGPSFRLTATDLTKAAATHKSAGSEASTRALQLVGFMVSSTGSGALNRELLRDIRTLLPSADQPILMLRAESVSNASVTVHTGVDGDVKTCAPELKVEVSPSEALATAVPFTRPAVADPAPHPVSLPKTPAGVEMPSWRARTAMLGAIAASMLLCYMTVAVPIIRAAGRAPALNKPVPKELLSLHVSERGSLWLVSWDGHNTVLKTASLAMIEIHARKAQKTIILTPGEGLSGQLFLPRESERVSVTFTAAVDNHVLAQETAALEAGALQLEKKN